MWVGGQRHAPGALPREGDPGTHFTVRRSPPPLPASGSIWTGMENLVNIGVRTPDTSARSESQYRLRYRGRLDSTEIEKPKRTAVTMSITKI